MSNYTEDDLVRWASLEGQRVDETIRALAEEIVEEIKAGVWDELSNVLEDEVSFSIADEYPNPYRTVKDN